MTSIISGWAFKSKGITSPKISNNNNNNNDNNFIYIALIF